MNHNANDKMIEQRFPNTLAQRNPLTLHFLVQCKHCSVMPTIWITERRRHTQFSLSIALRTHGLSLFPEDIEDL